MSVTSRLRQAVTFTRPNAGDPPPVPVDADARLTDAMRMQFRILSNADQRHLLAVYTSLREQGADDDTVTAGLIHDVGKACRRCSHNVAQRTAHVLLNRFLPRPYRRFAAMVHVPEILWSMQVLANHAERGAKAAGQQGYPPRVCDLVRTHESGGDADDRELRLLREADDRAVYEGTRP